MSWQIKRILMIAAPFLLAACTGTVSKSYSDIKITSQQNSLEETNLMKDVCQQFKLTEGQVLNYFREASVTDEATIHAEYNILPCYSTGKINISGKTYNWIIRAGGVGEYFNDTKKILLVCEEKCCKKTKGIC